MLRHEHADAPGGVPGRALRRAARRVLEPVRRRRAVDAPSRAPSRPRTRSWEPLTPPTPRSPTQPRRRVWSRRSTWSSRRAPALGSRSGPTAARSQVSRRRLDDVHPRRPGRCTARDRRDRGHARSCPSARATRPRTASCSSRRDCTSSADVTLTMTSPEEIPVGRQLVFEFSDDGGEVVAAEPVLDDERLVVHVGHFSGFGFARPAGQGPRGMDRVAHRACRGADPERDARHAEQGAPGAAPGHGGETTTPSSPRSSPRRPSGYEKEVVRVRLANADTSCAAAKQAAQTALGYMRQMDTPRDSSRAARAARTAALDPRRGVRVSSSSPCEKDAVARCKAARDPAILLGFWTEAQQAVARQVHRRHDEGGDDLRPADVPGRRRSPGLPRRPHRVQHRGALQAEEPGRRHDEGVGRTERHVHFSGKFALDYTGTYRIEFPDGARRPGTMTSTGSGSVAGQGGSGTETFTLTPLGPEC